MALFASMPTITNTSESDLEWDPVLPNMENERICETPYMSTRSGGKGSLKKMTYTPTPKLSERKRALFHKSSELGLTDDEPDTFFASPSSRQSYDELLSSKTFFTNSNILKKASFLSRIEDLDNDILLNADNSSDSDSLPNQISIENKENLSFHQVVESNKSINLINKPSPASSQSSPQLNFVKKSKQFSNIIVAETPQKEGTPKTPYETLNKDLELPRINNRKSLVEIFNNESINEKYIDLNQFPSETNDSVSQNISLYLSPEVNPRKSSTSSPDSPKKLPKARTSLFSSDSESPCTSLGISPERFYSSHPPSKDNIPLAIPSFPATSSKKMDKIPKKMKTAPVFLCGRSNLKSKQRRSFSEINAGVRTGIKKIKPKKMNRSVVQSTAFKQEVLKLVQTQNNSIWNKKPENSELPVDKVAAIDSLMKEIKKPKLDRKRTFTQSFSLSALHSREKIARTESSDIIAEKPRKFFKAKPTDKFTINIFNNIKLRVENEKNQPPQPLEMPPLIFDPVEPSSLTENVNMEEILQTLDAENPAKSNSITLSAYYSQMSEENSILLHKPPEEVVPSVTPPAGVGAPGVHQVQHGSKSVLVDDVIMSPTSVMCNMTSGLALTSPKKNHITKAENLTTRLEQCGAGGLEEKNTEKIKKLYPLFLKRKHEEEMSTMSPSRKRVNRSWRTLDDEQYQLDAGQKRWGLTQCSHCEFVYQQGEPDEEQRHTDFHNNVHYLRYNGWKNERVVDQFSTRQYRIIEVDRNDKKIWWKKIEDVLLVVDKELGYAEEKNSVDKIYKVYFCVEKRQIIGFITTTVVSKAHRMIPGATVDCCSKENYPVKCGVSRIWVANEARRKGIATRMMNAVRNTFLLGYRLTLNDIAFSVPSDSGKLFIKKFTNTDAYLIYDD